MRSFVNNQERIRDYLNDAFDGLSPFNQIEEIDRQNMRTFEQSVTMFAPPARGLSASARSPDPESGTNGEDAAMAALERLRAQLGAMQRQLDALSRKEGG
jgi:polyhydroxyalkanoate synthesis regulator protein